MKEQTMKIEQQAREIAQYGVDITGDMAEFGEPKLPKGWTQEIVDTTMIGVDFDDFMSNQ